MTQPQHLNPFQPEVIEHPYPMHERLRDAGVYRMPGTDTFIVSRWSDVEHVLKRSDLYSNLTGLDPHGMSAEALQRARETGSLPGSDPPEHTAYRRLAGPYLSNHGLAAFEPRAREIIDGLIDAFIDDGEVELAKQFSTPLTVHVFVNLLGIADEDLGQITRWVDDTIDAMAASVGLLPPERAEEIRRSGEEFRRFLVGLALDRRAHPRDDLLTRIVTTPMADLGGRVLHEQELQGMLVTILMGGTETTLNLIDSGMWLLQEHPERMAEIRADHSLIPNFVEEALRIESPVQCLFRRAIVDSEIGGVHVPEGSRIAVLYGAANRDPERWADPGTFDIHRDDAKRHMAFGAGVHYCIGSVLARMEARIAFERLLTRMRDIRYARGRNDFRHGPSHVIRGFKQLWLEFEKA